MKNTNNVNGNQTRYLLARSALHQPTGPPRIPQEFEARETNKKVL